MSYHGFGMPKLRSYTLSSPELSHILREPPKSIHTRKKERVDMSDVTHMIRNDDSRINEGVSYLARSSNPHIDVMYNSSAGGSRTTTMPNIQSGSIYKVMKDGAFRPPEFRQEDLQALSRTRRPESAVSTNPGIRSGYNIHNLESVIDKDEIKRSIDKTKINYINIRPTAVYKMDLPKEIFTANAINKNVNHISASAGLRGPSDGTIMRMANNDPLQASKNALLTSATANTNMMGNTNRYDNIDINNYIKDNIILENISPNFSISVYNPSTQNYSEVFASTKDKLNIAVQSSMNNPISLTREDGTQIKIKDYRYQIVHSAVGGEIGRAHV